MKISKEELIQGTSETGFRPEILEKVWRLMAILDGINTHPFLKNRLVLKGGTALNLFFFELPRLSVDIDLNYVGKTELQEMLLERPEVEKALESVFQREELLTRRIPEKHAGGKWQLRYESVLGGNGTLEIDLNFMFRIPLFEIVKKTSHMIGSRQTKEIALLDIHELGAGKLAALFGRNASRDLFDAHQLLTKCSINPEQFRTVCVVYGAMGTKDWRKVSVNDIQLDKKDLKNQLIPVLKKNLVNATGWEDWVNRLLKECTNALGMLFPLRENEMSFLTELFERGTINAPMLTQDPKMIEKIASHPLLQWKALLISQNGQGKVFEIPKIEGISLSSLIVDMKGKQLVEKVKEALAAGVDVNDDSRNGHRPLQLALAKGYTEVARLLIEQGADLHYKDRSGKTPLQCAINHGQIQNAKLLIKKGVPFDQNNLNLEFDPIRHYQFITSQ